MRLIHTATLLLHDFPLGEVPPYAILSHTWGVDEVSFHDMSSLHRFQKRGYDKIIRTCSLAQEDGLEFVWIDASCIDKSSSAELGESINSMFQWYMNAVVCYVFLADLPPNTSAKSGLLRCRWFTRGWTLQELVAPKVVKFYDADWSYVGTKLDFVDIISNSTGIPVEVLLGRRALSDSSIAIRMSWAAHRQTTRVEDMAYCLLGIFQVNMPLIYGEGPRAFRRLQEQIVQRNNDLTVFAWDLPREDRHQFLGLFAPSPAAFAASSGIVPFFDDFANFSVTNGGLYLTGGIPIRTADIAIDGVNFETLYLLLLGTKLNLSASDENLDEMDGGIYLRKIGPKLFCRDWLLPLAGFGADVEQRGIYEVSETNIVLDPTAAITRASSLFRNLAIHIPYNTAFQLQEAIPETLWDHTDRVFLRPKRYHWAMYPMVLAMTFGVKVFDTTVPLAVLCDYRERAPILKVFSPNQGSRESAIIFQQRHRQESLSWDEVDIHAPSIHTLSNSTTVCIENSFYLISASLQKGIVGPMSRNMEVLSLVISVKNSREALGPGGAEYRG